MNSDSVILADEQASRWEPRIKVFEAEDEISMPPSNAILFVGSSSIVFWRSLQQDMAPLVTINRGFGGSQMFELNEFRDRIVTKYKPRAIVVYEGDNDVASGREYEQIISDFDDFVSHIHQTLPNSDICFIAVKPSLLRASLWPKMKQVNEALKSKADQHDNLCYLDIANPMLKNDGSVNPDLFVSDGLHLNKKGYELWTSVIRPILINRYSESTKLTKK